MIELTRVDDGLFLNLGGIVEKQSNVDGRTLVGL
jgi:hypothetical protein